MKRTRKALLSSIIALVLCFSMLLGTTWAWFTDEVTSGGNIIQSGTLKAEMFWSDNGAEGTFADASQGAIFNYQHWEPGFTQIKYVKVENTGNLAFRYMLNIIPSTLPVAGEANLADVIDVYFAMNPQGEITRENVSSTMQRAGTLSQLMATAGGAVNGVLLPTSGSAKYDDILAKEANAQAGNTTYCIALKMQEAAGNEYQNKTVNGSFSVQLLASQYTYESDSFGNDYDQNAVADFFPGFQDGTAGIAVAADEQGKTADEVTMAGGDVSAVIPAGVLLADGATSLELTVTVKATSEANIQLGANEEMRSLDVHMEGVAQDNTVPMLITLKQYLATGINTGALKLYHVENGASVAMKHVANPENHNEFSYDPLTGDVTLALKSFSEVAVVADTNNTWDGTVATAFAGGTGTEANPYQIANADQLAYFRNEVDRGRTFDNEFVQLTANIYLSKVNFDPIGWGYETSAWNRDGVAGKPFKGTFDGGYYDKEGKLRCYTIFDLYQNGWDLESENKTDYTYTNCGFGLFAAAADATFKNLTIYGADIKTECVEMGVLVGLSQGSCTYENIEIHNSKIANYQRPTGGLIGEVSPLNGGTTTITDVTIGSDVVVGSLWGDFDAPCGGVIGARWDDTNTTTVYMKDVTVGCRMDVYSDVTSAYQWYAYRRAGMLMGNTEQTAENNKHLAAAPFLTCENVKVYYGNWAAYHYCQFTNQDDAWCNNYPWVRVEEGENCSAYSNPRYGQPVVGGATVSTDNHTCTGGNHMTELRFNQLYGGGQGVYGQPAHDGVEVINYRYSITYVNDYQVLAIKYVTETGAVETKNDAARDLVEKWAAENLKEVSWKFGGWMNAGSTNLTEIDANNTKDIVLYPWFDNPYTARFVDQLGNVVAYCFFHKNDLEELEATRADAEAALPNTGEDLKFDYWEVRITDNDGNFVRKEDYNVNNFRSYEADVTIYPVYKFEGDVKLIPVDTDSDGTIDYYQVAGYNNPNGQAMVKIPNSVNGIPVTEINGSAFASYDGVHSILVPENVTYIGNNAFAEKWGTLDDGESVTIYYAGSYADWATKEEKFGNNWESGISSSSRIFFLNGGETVDVSQGYLQADVKNNWGTRTVTWNHNTTISTSIVEEYTKYCNCKEQTTGDTAHRYVDAAGNDMQHNDAGTPVNANGKEIYFQDGGWFGSDKLTDGTNTYYRYRPDAQYWN